MPPFKEIKSPENNKVASFLRGVLEQVKAYPVYISFTYTSNEFTRPQMGGIFSVSIVMDANDSDFFQALHQNPLTTYLGTKGAFHEFNIALNAPPNMDFQIDQSAIDIVLKEAGFTEKNNRWGWFNPSLMV